MTAEFQQENIRRLSWLQIRTVIRDSRSWGTRRTCFNHPLLQQTPPCLLFPNHPENYVAPLSISWHIFITTQKRKTKKLLFLILNSRNSFQCQTNTETKEIPSLKFSKLTYPCLKFKHKWKIQDKNLIFKRIPISETMKVLIFSVGKVTSSNNV